MADPKFTSGEINVMILNRINEVATKVESVSESQAELKLSVQLALNDGKHRMDGFAQRIEELEKKNDNDWTPPRHHKAIRQETTDRVAKKVDPSLWIKIGLLVGAAAAGWAAANGLTGKTP